MDVFYIIPKLFDISNILNIGFSAADINSCDNTISLFKFSRTSTTFSIVFNFI